MGEGDVAATALPHPAVDVETPDVAIMLSDRDVVGMSSWLVDAVVTRTHAGEIPVLLTGPDTRITPAVRELVMTGRLYWAVELPDGRMYEAVEGRAIELVDGRFVPATPGPRAPEFGRVTDADRADAAWQVIVSATVEHRADRTTELGHGLAALSSALTGTEPSGWGLYEPVTEPWRPAELTTFLRRRMPEPTTLVAVTAPTTSGGRGMLATVTARRTERGVEEEINALACAGALDVPFGGVIEQSHDALVALAAAGTVGFAWTLARPGAADLAEVARERAAPVPTGLCFGPRAVRALGDGRVRSAPLPPPTQIGKARVPGYVWRLGRAQSGWDELQALTDHLGARRIVDASPAFAQLLGMR